MDLEVFGAIDEAEHGSVTKEAEEAAKTILDGFIEEEEIRLREEIERCAQRRDYAQAAALESHLRSLWPNKEIGKADEASAGSIQSKRT